MSTKATKAAEGQIRSTREGPADRATPLVTIQASHPVVVRMAGRTIALKPGEHANLYLGQGNPITVDQEG